jgi:hypothetical protein
MRPRVTRRAMLKLPALGVFKDDLLSVRTRHRHQDSPPEL